MGLELDPRELTDREAAVLAAATAWYKRNRGWLHRADILRLDSPDPAVIGEQHLAEDGSRFVVFLGRAAAGAPIAPRPQPLTRLDPRRPLSRAARQRRGSAAALPRHPGARRRGRRGSRGLADRSRPDPSLVVPRNHVGDRGGNACDGGLEAHSRRLLLPRALAGSGLGRGCVPHGRGRHQPGAHRRVRLVGASSPAPESSTSTGWTGPLATLGSAGLEIVLGTPTAAPPRWMVDRHPDMLPVDIRWPDARVRFTPPLLLQS